jgi:hypothetical protein
LDNLSHCLFWFKGSTIGEQQLLSVELPRLPITFKCQVASDGKWRLFCQEVNGFFLVGVGDNDDPERMLLRQTLLQVSEECCCRIWPGKKSSCLAIMTL